MYTGPVRIVLLPDEGTHQCPECDAVWVNVINDKHELIEQTILQGGP